jgi:hypothetical protein
MKDKQNVKYVTLDIATRLCYEDLTRLVSPLKMLDDFSFLLKSEIFTDSNAIAEISKSLNCPNFTSAVRFADSIALIV